MLGRAFRLWAIGVGLGLVGLLSCGDASATEIRGLVVKATTDEVMINITSGYRPNPGDKVEISTEIPGLGVRPFSGTWRVTQVTQNHVLAAPEGQTSGTPQPGDMGVIFSANPRPKSADSQSPPTSPGPPAGPSDLSAVRNAAERGDPEAQYSLGLMYAAGRGVPQNFAEARKWFRKSAEQGNARAQTGLGLMYMQGAGVRQDYAEARRWWQRAAEQGYAVAQHNLGVMYSEGIGVPQNNDEGVKWYRKAAEQGYAGAQYSLGFMYAAGRGVPQNFAEARKWFRKSADQGNADAQYELGFMYHSGAGVHQDFAEAAKWYRKAAERGDEAARKALGELSARGLIK